MKVTIKQAFDVEISKQDLGREIIHHVWNAIGQPDDAGCDWYTDYDSNNIYINNNIEWLVSSNSNYARLIDAGNILLNGGVLKVYFPKEE